MNFNIKSAFRKSVDYSKKQYASHYKLINSVCALPFLVLKKIEIYDFTVNLILVLGVVYALVFGLKILYRQEESLKSVLLSCTVKSHPVSAIFWMIIGGLAAMGVNKVNEIRQDRIDREEFLQAYAQYQNAILYDYVDPREDCNDFIKGYGYYNQKDYVEAAPHLKKASEKCAVAAYLYGNILYHGLGVSADKYEALKYYKQAAEKEVVEAKYRLMMHYIKENDYDSAEANAMDILNKIYLESLDDLHIVLTKELKDPSELQEITTPWIYEIHNELLVMYNQAYTFLYTFSMVTEQYDNAVYISDLITENLCHGISGEHAVDKALCMLLGGDRFGAKRVLKKIMRDEKYDEIDVRLAEEAYVRNILLPEGKDITVRAAKEAEKLLIKNIRQGSRESMQMLKELYDRAGYIEEAARIGHLESYYKLSGEYERK